MDKSAYFRSSRRPLAPGRVYHFCVIYNHASCSLSRTEDTNLALQVTTALVERLELQGYVNSYYYDRDYRSRSSLSAELGRVIAGSSVIIILLTPGFVHYCIDRYQQISAFRQFVSSSSQRFIVLSVGVPRGQVPAQLSGNHVLYFHEDWEVDVPSWIQFENTVQCAILGSASKYRLYVEEWKKKDTFSDDGFYKNYTNNGNEMSKPGTNKEFSISWSNKTWNDDLNTDTTRKENELSLLSNHYHKCQCRKQRRKTIKRHTLNSRHIVYEQSKCHFFSSSCLSDPIIQEQQKFLHKHYNLKDSFHASHCKLYWNRTKTFCHCKDKWSRGVKSYPQSGITQKKSMPCCRNNPSNSRTFTPALNKSVRPEISQHLTNHNHVHGDLHRAMHFNDCMYSSTVKKTTRKLHQNTTEKNRMCNEIYKSRTQIRKSSTEILFHPQHAQTKRGIPDNLACKESKQSVLMFDYMDGDHQAIGSEDHYFGLNLFDDQESWISDTESQEHLSHDDMETFSFKADMTVDSDEETTYRSHSRKYGVSRTFMPSNADNSVNFVPEIFNSDIFDHLAIQTAVNLGRKSGSHNKWTSESLDKWLADSLDKWTTENIDEPTSKNISNRFNDIEKDMLKSTNEWESCHHDVLSSGIDIRDTSHYQHHLRSPGHIIRNEYASSEILCKKHHNTDAVGGDEVDSIKRSAMQTSQERLNYSSTKNPEIESAYSLHIVSEDALNNDKHGKETNKPPENYSALDHRNIKPDTSTESKMKNSEKIHIILDFIDTDIMSANPCMDLVIEKLEDRNKNNFEAYLSTGEGNVVDKEIKKNKKTIIDGEYKEFFDSEKLNEDVNENIALNIAHETGNMKHSSTFTARISELKDTSTNNGSETKEVCKGDVSIFETDSPTCENAFVLKAVIPSSRPNIELADIPSNAGDKANFTDSYVNPTSNTDISPVFDNQTFNADYLISNTEMSLESFVDTEQNWDIQNASSKGVTRVSQSVVEPISVSDSTKIFQSGAIKLSKNEVNEVSGIGISPACKDTEDHVSNSMSSVSDRIMAPVCDNSASQTNDSDVTSKCDMSATMTSISEVKPVCDNSTAQINDSEVISVSAALTNNSEIPPASNYSAAQSNDSEVIQACDKSVAQINDSEGILVNKNNDNDNDVISICGKSAELTNNTEETPVCKCDAAQTNDNEMTSVNAAQTNNIEVSPVCDYSAAKSNGNEAILVNENYAAQTNDNDSISVCGRSAAMTSDNSVAQTNNKVMSVNEVLSNNSEVTLVCDYSAEQSNGNEATLVNDNSAAQTNNSEVTPVCDFSAALTNNTEAAPVYDNIAAETNDKDVTLVSSALTNDSEAAPVYDYSAAPSNDGEVILVNDSCAGKTNDNEGTSECDITAALANSSEEPPIYDYSAEQNDSEVIQVNENSAGQTNDNKVIPVCDYSKALANNSEVTPVHNCSAAYSNGSDVPPVFDYSAIQNNDSEAIIINENTAAQTNDNELTSVSAALTSNSEVPPVCDYSAAQINGSKATLVNENCAVQTKDSKVTPICDNSGSQINGNGAISMCEMSAAMASNRVVTPVCDNSIAKTNDNEVISMNEVLINNIEVTPVCDYSVAQANDNEITSVSAALANKSEVPPVCDSNAAQTNGNEATLVNDSSAAQTNGNEATLVNDNTPAQTNVSEATLVNDNSAAQTNDNEATLVNDSEATLVNDNSAAQTNDSEVIPVCDTVSDTDLIPVSSIIYVTHVCDRDINQASNKNVMLTHDTNTTPVCQTDLIQADDTGVFPNSDIKFISVSGFKVTPANDIAHILLHNVNVTPARDVDDDTDSDVGPPLVCDSGVTLDKAIYTHTHDTNVATTHVDDETDCDVSPTSVCDSGVSPSDKVSGTYTHDIEFTLEYDVITPSNDADVTSSYSSGFMPPQDDGPTPTQDVSRSAVHVLGVNQSSDTNGIHVIPTCDSNDRWLCHRDNSPVVDAVVTISSDIFDNQDSKRDSVLSFYSVVTQTTDNNVTSVVVTQSLNESYAVHENLCKSDTVRKCFHESDSLESLENDMYWSSHENMTVSQESLKTIVDGVNFSSVTAENRSSNERVSLVVPAHSMEVTNSETEQSKQNLNCISSELPETGIDIIYCSDKSSHEIHGISKALDSPVLGIAGPYTYILTDQTDVTDNINLDFISEVSNAETCLNIENTPLLSSLDEVVNEEHSSVLSIDNTESKSSFLYSLDETDSSPVKHATIYSGEIIIGSDFTEGSIECDTFTASSNLSCVHNADSQDEQEIISTKKTIMGESILNFNTAVSGQSCDLMTTFTEESNNNSNVTNEQNLFFEAEEVKDTIENTVSKDITYQEAHKPNVVDTECYLVEKSHEFHQLQCYENDKNKSSTSTVKEKDEIVQSSVTLTWSTAGDISITSEFNQECFSDTISSTERPLYQSQCGLSSMNGDHDHVPVNTGILTNSENDSGYFDKDLHSYTETEGIIRLFKQTTDKQYRNDKHLLYVNISDSETNSDKNVDLKLKAAPDQSASCDTAEINKELKTGFIRPENNESEIKTVLSSCDLPLHEFENNENTHLLMTEQNVLTEEKQLEINPSTFHDQFLDEETGLPEALKSPEDQHIKPDYNSREQISTMTIGYTYSGNEIMFPLKEVSEQWSREVTDHLVITASAQSALSTLVTVHQLQETGEIPGGDLQLEKYSDTSKIELHESSSFINKDKNKCLAELPATVKCINIAGKHITDQAEQTCVVPHARTNLSSIVHMESKTIHKKLMTPTDIERMEKHTETAALTVHQGEKTNPSEENVSGIQTNVTHVSETRANVCSVTKTTFEIPDGEISENCTETSSLKFNAPKEFQNQQDTTQVDYREAKSSAMAKSGTESENEVDWSLEICKGVCHVLSNPEMPYLG